MVSITNTGWCASTGRWSAGTDHWYPGKSLTPASRHLSEELTGQWKTKNLNMYLHFKMVIFHCHLGFRGCTLWKSKVLMLHGQTWPHRYAAGMIVSFSELDGLLTNGCNWQKKAVLWVHHDRQFELIPSRELTYPLPTHVWRWVTFSQGGIC